MTNFILIRHGKTNQNKLKKIQGQLDYPLSEEGIIEANLCGKFLKENNYKIDHIYSSPLERAKKTAEIIASYFNIEKVYENQFFIERCFGEFEGKDVNEKNFSFISKNIGKDLEKYDDLVKRTMVGLNELVKIYPAKTILIVSHSNIIKAITSYIDSKNYTISDKINNCSLTNVAYDNGIYKVLDFNIQTIN